MKNGFGASSKFERGVECEELEAVLWGAGRRAVPRDRRGSAATSAPRQGTARETLV